MLTKSKMYGKINGGDGVNGLSLTAAKDDDEEVEVEMRPGGMLVQKRLESEAPPPSNIRLRVAYGALRCNISVNSQATFGELKKLLKGETGLEPEEQRIEFRGKERANGEYLDASGVKDRSKILVSEDPSSIERRYTEMRKNARIQKSLRAISDISMEIDKLADQVSVMEESVLEGKKVPEVQITTLMEVLMRQAIKLDAMSAEGDASSQQIIQSKRVQKCVEMLDLVKASNARVKAVVVTSSNKWETFDPPLLSTPAPTSQWELFN